MYEGMIMKYLLNKLIKKNIENLDTIRAISTLRTWY